MHPTQWFSPNILQCSQDRPLNSVHCVFEEYGISRSASHCTLGTALCTQHSGHTKCHTAQWILHTYCTLHSHTAQLTHKVSHCTDTLHKQIVHSVRVHSALCTLHSVVHSGYTKWHRVHRGHTKWHRTLSVTVHCRDGRAWGQHRLHSIIFSWWRWWWLWWGGGGRRTILI